jgi:hypothetical protein
MAGLVPAIHVGVSRLAAEESMGVDTRNKCGHDEMCVGRPGPDGIRSVVLKIIT